MENIIQCRKAESLIWKVIFELQNLISELECNSELPFNLDNTLYQLFVTKGKLDCCIDQSVRRKCKTSFTKSSKLLDNLLQAKEELDRCIDEFTIQHEHSELLANLLEAKQELGRCKF